ncbi:MAG: threonine synthase [Proteobacteria bacterium]|nr:MAG: threonine synthase [Pseudomonadota bacterium]
MYYLRDFVTKKTVNPTNMVFTGETNPWEVVMDLDEVKSKINLDYFRQSPPNILKYLPLLPITKQTEFITLRESATPLIKSRKLGRNLGVEILLKVEGKNPTGSFKDRGTAVEISVAREKGAKAIILASTGNMAASCACYAAAAGIPCFVMVPEGVSPGKLSQVLAFGGHIVQVKGTYNDAADLAYRIAEKMGFYLAGDYAFRLEGAKTAAFEIIDQMLFQVPDYLVVPIGCGTNIGGYYKGFMDYYRLGLIDRLPRIIGVQAEGARAVVNSFEEKRGDIQALPSINTLATAIAVANPLDGLKALEAINSTNGYAVSVTDNEILAAQHRLAKEEGIFAESSAASTIAGVQKLIEQGKIDAHKKVMCILTGDGLKDPQVVLKAAIKPPTIYPQVQEFSNLYQNGFFDGKSMVFVEKSDILFANEPTKSDITRELQNLFAANYGDEYLEKIHESLAKMIQKGKTITISDFQDSIQGVLESPRKEIADVFSVIDFQVDTAKDKKAHATVVVNIAGQEYTGQADGTGPVDAVIKSLTHACRDTLEFKLTEYKVEIRGQGTDANVYVEMKLQQGTKNSIGSGTSPDIIQASIEAFAAAYNAFNAE